MKVKLLIISLLISTHVLAEKYFVVAASTTMSSAGKKQVLTNIRNALGDIADVKDSPKWVLRSNTNQIARTIWLRADDLGIKDFKNITLTKVENKIENGLSEADKTKLIVRRAENFRANFEPLVKDLPAGE